MPKSTMPNWSGDPAKCPYCKKGEFPHAHNPDEDAPEPQEKPAKERKPRAKTKPATSAEKRPRGRPMSPENALLLKVCTCKTPALSSV